MQGLDPNKMPIRDSTQAHLDIVDIRDDLVILRGKKVSLVIQTSAVNFELLSDQEKSSRILAFAQLLNSINYPMQVVIRTKKVDITGYIEYLEDYLKKPMSEGRKHTMKIYLEFVKNLIVKNEILDKKFYVIVTYNTTPLTELSKMPFGKKKDESKSDVSERFMEKAKLNLDPKRDHIIKQLSNMGVQSEQLNTEKLKKLFYDIYNYRGDKK